MLECPLALPVGMGPARSPATSAAPLEWNTHAHSVCWAGQPGGRAGRREWELAKRAAISALWNAPATSPSPRLTAHA